MSSASQLLFSRIQGRSGATATPTMWTPLELFTGSEIGVWYDFKDTDSLYQDISRTTPVTSNSDPIAAVDDKSGNGNFATVSTGSDNPTFDLAHGIRMTLTSERLTSVVNSYWTFLEDSPATVAIAFRPGLSQNPDTLAAIVATAGSLSSSTKGYQTGYDDRSSSSRDNGHYLLIAKGTFGTYGVNHYTDSVLMMEQGNRCIITTTPTEAVAEDRSYKNINGIVQPDGNAGTEPVSPGTGAGNELSIGANTVGDNDYEGYISQIVVIDRVLTEEEIVSLDSYLMASL